MSRLLCLVAFSFLVQFTEASRADRRVFTPYQFGAKGDAVSNDTLPLQMALDAAAEFGGGIVWIPPNGTHLMGAGLLAIGHKYDGITFQIDGTLQVTRPPVKWPPCRYITPGLCASSVLYAYNVDALTVTSRTQGKILGFLFDEHVQPTPPGANQFMNCTNLLVENILVKHIRTQMQIHFSQNVTIRNLTLFNRANPEEGGNMEIGGIGGHGAPWVPGWQYEAPLMRANNVTVRDVFFNGGDDNIVIKKDTSNVLVENCTIGDGHGVGLGSTPDCNGCYGYTENITFRGLTLTGNAPLKIKTWPNTTGVIKNILFENITLLNGAETLLSISTWYGCGCPRSWCHEWVKPNTKCRYVPFAGGQVSMGGICAQTDNNIAIENITLRHVRGSVGTAGSILCREPAPCTINIEDVQLEAKRGWTCGNARFDSAGTTNIPPLPSCDVGPHFEETISV